MEWWVYGPLIIAVIMFLLVGTVFERRIEVALRRFMDTQHEQLNQRETGITNVSDGTTSDSLRPNPATSTPPLKSSQSLTNPATATPCTVSPIHPIIKTSKQSTVFRTSSLKNLPYERSATVILNKSTPKLHA